MTAKLDELTGLLEEHQGHYEKLSQMLVKERAALINIDLDQIQQIAKAKENTILKVKLLLPPLSRAIKAAAAEYGVPEDPLPTLAELAGAVPQLWSGKLRRAGLTLARHKRTITRHNNTNRNFVQEALDMISGSIAVLTGATAMAPKSGYLSNGHRAPNPGYSPVKLSREV